MSDPLRELLVDKDQLDRELLSKVLKHYLKIDKDSHSVRFTAMSEELTIDNKIIIFLLARKAMKAMELTNTESSKPGEIEKATGIKGGTLRPKLSKMYDKKLIDKDEAGGYFVSDHSVEIVARRFE